MTTNELQRLVLEKMHKENLSLRKAARASGLSHTTISRIQEGGAVDIDTLLAVSKWLDVPPSRVLDGYRSDEGNLEARIGSLLDLNPKLRDVFKKAMERFEKCEVSADAVEDLLAYATFRLSIEKDEEDADSSEENGD